MPRWSCVEQIRGTKQVTVGGDKGSDTADFVAECRNLKVTPHVAQNLEIFERSLVGLASPCKKDQCQLRPVNAGEMLIVSVFSRSATIASKSDSAASGRPVGRGCWRKRTEFRDGSGSRCGLGVVFQHPAQYKPADARVKVVSASNGASQAPPNQLSDEDSR